MAAKLIGVRVGPTTIYRVAKFVSEAKPRSKSPLVIKGTRFPIQSWPARFKNAHDIPMVMASNVQNALPGNGVVHHMSKRSVQRCLSELLASTPSLLSPVMSRSSINSGSPGTQTPLPEPKGDSRTPDMDFIQNVTFMGRLFNRQGEVDETVKNLVNTELAKLKKY